MKRVRTILTAAGGVVFIFGLLLFGLVRMMFGRAAQPRPEGFGERPLQEPPSLDAALARIEILKLRLRHVSSSPPRATLAEFAADWSREQRESFTQGVERRHSEVLEAMERPAIAGEIGDDERAMLTRKAEKLSQRQLLDGSWVAESLGCILWAIGRLDRLPPWDTQFEAESLQPFVEEPESVTATGAQLRPIDELTRMREIAEMWHWRSRTRYLTERGDSLPAGMPFESYDAIARFTAKAAVEKGMLSSVIGDDFPAMGKPYRDLTAEEWSLMTSIAMERHRALNWLCGYAPGNRWEETPTST